MATLIYEWVDSRPRHEKIRYRLVEDGSDRVIERAEKDKLGGERWTVVKSFSSVHADSEALLSNAIEVMRADFGKRIVELEKKLPAADGDWAAINHP